MHKRSVTNSSNIPRFMIGKMKKKFRERPSRSLTVAGEIAHTGSP